MAFNHTASVTSEMLAQTSDLKFPKCLELTLEECKHTLIVRDILNLEYLKKISMLKKMKPRDLHLCVKNVYNNVFSVIYS